MFSKGKQVTRDPHPRHKDQYMEKYPSLRISMPNSSRRVYSFYTVHTPDQLKAMVVVVRENTRLYDQDIEKVETYRFNNEGDKWRPTGKISLYVGEREKTYRYNDPMRVLARAESVLEGYKAALSSQR